MGNPFPWGLPCGARADAFRSRRQCVSIPSLGVCAFCGFQKVAVSNHGAALTGTNNVPEAHGEPPRPNRGFLGTKVAAPMGLSRKGVEWGNLAGWKIRRPYLASCTPIVSRAS